MLKFAHIINPCKVGPNSDLYIAQPITFESMRVAKEYVKEEIEVELVTTQFKVDSEIIPAYFNKAPNLERTIMDYGEFHPPRPLPLLKDVLDRLYDYSDAEYLIYTNSDIALQPYFYQVIAHHIKNGVDALVINRRTISKEYTSSEELPLMYGEIGKVHPGFDCFVFPRKAYPKYLLENICIGTSWIGRVFIWNLYCFSKNLLEIHNKALTFHIGDDRVWNSSKYSSYLSFNKHEAKKVHAQLRNYASNTFIRNTSLLHEQLHEELTNDLGEYPKSIQRNIPIKKESVSLESSLSLKSRIIRRVRRVFQ